MNVMGREKIFKGIGSLQNGRLWSPFHVVINISGRGLGKGPKQKFYTHKFSKSLCVTTSSL